MGPGAIVVPGPRGRGGEGPGPAAGVVSRGVRILRGRRLIAALWVIALLALRAPLAAAHEFTLDAVVNAFVKVEADRAHAVVRAPLYLFKAVRFPVKGAEIDVGESGDALRRAGLALQQGFVLLEDGQPLKADGVAARLSLPSDRSFESYEAAVEHVARALEAGTAIVVDQGYVDVHLTYPVARPGGVFSVRTALAPELGDYLKLTLRYLPAEGRDRALVVRGGAGTVELNPSRWDAGSGFLGLGIAHIAGGVDHLLFLLCLVIPLRGLRPLLAVITGFTVAHSFTLVGAAFGLAPRGAWFPPLVETGIAATIVYTALENIVGVSVPRRVLLGTLFGLVHGFAFSAALAEELQFAGSHLLVALLAFNVGIEIGQLVALAVMLPLLALLTRHVLRGRVGTIILSALVAHVAWHWMEERWDELAKVRWPVLDAASLLQLAAWAGGLLLVAGLVFSAASRLRLEAPAPARP